MQAIDEAEDEWSQHNAKKLIDTSVKGLHGSILKDFPYFHVEFGLSKGFVHIIDDETVEYRITKTNSKRINKNKKINDNHIRQDLRGSEIPTPQVALILY